MNIDIEQLAIEEVKRLVKEKINGKLHQIVQKELKNYEYMYLVREHIQAELKALFGSIDLLEYIDKEKLQKDVTDTVTKILIDRMTTRTHEDEENYYDEY